MRQPVMPTFLLNGDVVNAEITEIQMEGTWVMDDISYITITPQESDIFIFYIVEAAGVGFISRIT